MPEIYGRRVVKKYRGSAQYYADNLGKWQKATTTSEFGSKTIYYAQVDNNIIFQPLTIAVPGSWDNNQSHTLVTFTDLTIASVNSSVVQGTANCDDGSNYSYKVYAGVTSGGNGVAITMKNMDNFKYRSDSLTPINIGGIIATLK